MGVGPEGEAVREGWNRACAGLTLGLLVAAGAGGDPARLAILAAVAARRNGFKLQKDKQLDFKAAVLELNA